MGTGAGGEGFLSKKEKIHLFIQIICTIQIKVWKIKSKMFYLFQEQSRVYVEINFEGNFVLFEGTVS